MWLFRKLQTAVRILLVMEVGTVYTAHNVIVLALGFILGVILGSGIKALADRSLSYKSFWGRSYCPKCKHKLGWYDLLPIFSYIFLKGRCRYCHKKISIEYLLVELGMGLLMGFLFWQQFHNFKFEILNFLAGANN